jgi:hypothetical protein
VAGGNEDMRENAASLELESSLDCSNALDAAPNEAFIPAGSLSHLRCVIEKLDDGWVIAVDETRDQRHRASLSKRRAHG